MSFVDFIFPKQCLRCGRSGRYLCAKCISKVSLAKQICVECEKPAIDGITHIKCKKAWGIDGLVSVWVYEGVVRRGIVKLKYKFAFDIARELAKLASIFLKTRLTALPKKILLTTVPLHSFRKNWRGFNQSEEIGKLIASEMGWQFFPEMLIRRVQKTPQTELGGEERRKNVLGVFAINPKYDIRTIKPDIIVFDDVITTGSTLKEAVKVLKRNGAKKVWGLTIAR